MSLSKAPKELVKEIKKIIPPDRLMFDISMAKYTTFRIGGPADILINAESQNEILPVIHLCKNYDYPHFIMGAGSNLLIRDGGYRGLIIRINDYFRGIDLQEDCLFVKAGTSLPSLSRYAADKSLAGLEFACGIPGTVGGSIYMNAGAYEGEISQCFLYCNALSDDGVLTTYNNQDMDFSYRYSSAQANELIILNAAFRLHTDKKEDIIARMKFFTQKRIEKQPVDKPSAGSTFKRPLNAFAASLIEQCGLKGYRVGGAMVSEKHSGFIINDNNATARDVIDLMDYVSEIVYSMRAIKLEPELRIIGED